LLGVASLELADYASAASAFAHLLAANPDDVALRFNFAWAKAMLKQFDEALETLDEATVQALPQAAMLQIQLMHERGLFDEAATLARAHIERHPHYEGLLAAVSVLALDVEDADLAADCAKRGGDHPDALTTLGTLALGEDRTEEALALFNRVLARREHAPRAWVGKGLAELSSGDSEAAAHDIERGAELFGEHIGSWIAAGWANVIKGDIARGREMFAKALSLDHNFSESHGSLAVVDILEGRVDEARHSAQLAMRLDRQSFSGALANALLLQSDGKPEIASRIIERAMHTPVDASGRTIAMALARQGLSGFER
jgi:tetratricopeptide (TPR) repeat protein